MCDAENQQQTLAISPSLGCITLCACGTISGGWLTSILPKRVDLLLSDSASHCSSPLREPLFLSLTAP